MKRIITVPLVGISCFCLVSCDTISKVYQASTSGFNLSATHASGVVQDDQLVLRSEQLLVISLDTFDTFLKIERANRTTLDKVSPEIHTFAENVRRNGKGWIKSLEVAHDAYKNNRSSDNHATLITAFKTVQAAVVESQKYITKHGGV